MNKTAQSDRILLWIILIVAAVLRFIKLGDFSFTNDELSALSRLRFNGLGELIRQGVLTDAHPPGVQVFLAYWTFFFGTGEFMVRLPFVMVSLASVVAIYRIGKLWFNTHAGLIAAALLATLSYTLTYAQLARPYAFGLFFSLMVLYQLTKVLYEDSKPPTSRYVWLMIAFVLCMYTHYYCIIFAFFAGAIGLLRTNKVNRRPYILACIGACLLFIPGIPILMHQFDAGGGGTGGESGWLGAPEPDWIAGYLYYAFNASWYFIGATGLLILVGWIAKIKEFRINRYHAYAILLFLLAYGFGHAYSIWKNPILQYSVMLFAFPCLLLFLGSLGAVVRSNLSMALVLGILGAGLVSTTLEKEYYSTYRFGTMKELAELNSRWIEEYGADRITPVISVHNSYYIQYYNEQQRPPVTYVDDKTRGVEDLGELYRVVRDAGTEYFAYSWSTINTPPEVYEIIMWKFPIMVDDIQFPILDLDGYVNSRATLFKIGHNSRTVIWDTLVAPPNIDYQVIWSDSNDIRNGFTGRANMVSTDREYFGDIIVPVRRLGIDKLNYITAQVSVSGTATAQLVITVMRNGEALFWGSGQFETYSGEGDYHVFYTALPDMALLPDDEIRCYVWNLNGESFYLENLELTVYDGAP